MSDKHQHEEQEHVPTPRRRKAIPLRMARGVLATCDIRRPEWACENPACCLLLLADSPRERVQSKACICSSLSRGNGHCAEDSHLRHVLDTLVSSVAPPSLR